MDRIVFYFVDVDCRDSYRDFCNYVNGLYSYNVSVYWNQRFQYDYMKSLKGQLVYLSIEDEEIFKSILKKCNVSFEKKEILDKYNDWLDSRTVKKERLDSNSIDENKMEVFYKEQIPEIIETLDGSQYLTEETVAKKDSIKLYTYSNEQSGHFTPHVHVQYNQEKKFCVISLVDFKVLAPNNCPLTPKVKKCIELLKDNIDDAREAWNKTNAQIKFKYVDGKISGETYNTKI